MERELGLPEFDRAEVCDAKHDVFSDFHYLYLNCGIAIIRFMCQRFDWLRLYKVNGFDDETN